MRRFTVLSLFLQQALGLLLMLSNPGSTVALQATLEAQCTPATPNHIAPPEWLKHYANPEITFSENGIWATIPTDGELIISSLHEIKEEGPYQGWRATKMGWTRGDGVRGTLYVTGKRLDAPAPAAVDLFLESQMTSGYGTTGFTPVGLAFPSAGCWEITGVAGTHSVTFTLLVTFPEFAPWETPPATPVR